MKRFSHSHYKPPLGYGLNPAHPLAPYVVDAWFLQEFAGTNLTSLLYQTAIPTIGSPSWQGLGFLTNAVGAGASLTAPAYLKINVPISVCWQGWQVGTASSVDLFGLAYNNTNTTPFNASLIYWSGSAYHFATNHSGASSDLADTGTTAVSGRQQVIGTMDSTSQIIYRNGIKGANTTGTGTINYTATSQIGFGSITGNATANPKCIHEFGIIFSKALSQTEVQLLWTDPYDLLAPIRPRSRSKAVVGLPMTDDMRGRFSNMTGGFINA